MAAFDLLLDGTGQDTFEDLYDKYNDTITALKAGTNNQLLAGNGIGSSPTYKSLWEAYQVVNTGGGTPGWNADFTNANDSTISLRYKRSAILAEVKLNGRVKRINSVLANNTTALIFTLPVGYRPITPLVSVTGDGNFKLMAIVIDVLGNVFVINQTGDPLAINGQFDINLSFPTA